MTEIQLADVMAVGGDALWRDVDTVVQMLREAPATVPPAAAAMVAANALHVNVMLYESATGAATMVTPAVCQMQMRGPPVPAARRTLHLVALRCSGPRPSWHYDALMVDRQDVYTDGSAVTLTSAVTGEHTRSGGYAVFYGDGHPSNVSRPLPDGTPQTNNRAELSAAIEAVCTARSDVRVLTDSTYVINGVKAGGYGPKNADLWQRMMDTLMVRQEAALSTTFEWVRGHSGNAGNSRADEMAKRAATERTDDGSPSPGRAMPAGRPFPRARRLELAALAERIQRSFMSTEDRAEEDWLLRRELALAACRAAGDITTRRHNKQTAGHPAGGPDA